MASASALIFDIQKFSVHDGPGIRTTVFLKGCPLRCIWCHNPESWQARPELLFDAAKCTHCRACAALCPEHCHTWLPDGTHHFARARCRGCGSCQTRCYSNALELCGRWQSVAAVLAEVLKDRPFYENSGGGLTLSGGEPMFQFDFTLELAKKAKQAGLHVCMESSGFAEQEQFQQIMPFVDLFLFDIKTLDSEKHRRFTGHDNTLILNNLRFLDQSGAQLHLRCPLIPRLNDSPEELSAITALAESLSQVRAIELEPYHPLGTAKAARLGMPDPFKADFPSKESRTRWREHIAARTSIPVRIV
jgi:glycyl-radical enzyme activating protein